MDLSISQQHKHFSHIPYIVQRLIVTKNDALGWEPVVFSIFANFGQNLFYSDAKHVYIVTP